MNKTFHSVWNASKQAWVAAAETVSAKGKPTSGVKVAAVISALFGGLLTLSAHAQNAPPANMLPTGGQVNAGQASISTSGANMVIQQSSSRASINWQSFNVGSNAQVQFQQPDANSVTLNRVMSADPSQIFGRISANGQIVLTNPAGIYFAPNARVDVGGLIATTHDISDADFMAGKSRFDRNASTGSVVNEGELKAALGGYIALLAPEVRNQGAIIAQMGTVAMASGEAVDLKFDSNNRLTSLRVDASQIAALVDNRHAVQAPGGLVIISAQSIDRLVGGVVKNSGRIEATGIQSDGGRIVLTGSHKVSNSGSLDVSSATAQGGSISVQSADIELNDGTRIDARGATGGGTVLVGGNWQGSVDPLLAATEQPTQAATTVTMTAGATLDASATQQGNGGTVVLWSDVANPSSNTSAYGHINANGGAVGGNGGQIETSGHTLNTDGIAVHAASNGGKNGLWLLDPTYSTINAAAVTNFLTSLNGGTDVLNSATNISWTTGVNLLKNAGGDATLTLRAGVDLAIGNTISISSTSGKLNLLLWSGWDSSGSRGIISIGSASITTNGGHVWAGGGAYNEATTTWNGLTVSPGHATAFNAKTIGLKLNGTSINTNGGDIFLKGRNSNAAGIGTQAINATLDSGSGNVTFEVGGGVNIGVSLEGSTSISGTGDLKFNVINAYSTIPTPIKTNGTLSLNRGAGNVTFIADNFSSSTFNLTTTGTLTVTPYLASFTSAFSLNSITLGGTLSGLTIGKSGNTAAITIDTATSVAGPISIYGGNITLNAGLTATGSNTITLQGSGTTTDGVSGFVSASNLFLSGSGSVTLDNSTSNAVDTLAATGGTALTYLNSGALTLGTVGATNGISATGTVSIGTKTGDLTVSQNVSTTNTSSSALVLNAGIDSAAGSSTGGNLILTGSPTVSVGTGGFGKLYTGSISGSTGLTGLTNLASGSGRFRYNSDETNTRYTTALTTGLNAIFREQPTATISSLALSMTYGDALPTMTGTGTVNGDATDYSITARLNSTSGNIKASGTPYVITEKLTGLGYLVNSSSSASTGTLTVAAKALTMSGLSVAASKVYNGNTSATVSGTVTLLSAEAVGSGTNTDGKRYTGDTVSITGTAVGTYNSQDVANASTVTFSGLSLTGADASNYSLTVQSPASATITAKALTMSGLTVSASRIYDGTTAATVSGTAALLSSEAVGTGTTADGKPYTGDTVALIGTAVGTYNSKDVATANAVTFSGLSLNNSNYSLSIQSPAAATITVKSLTMSGLIVPTSKVYDGTTAASNLVNANFAVTGWVAGEGATVSQTAASYSSKNVSDNIGAGAVSAVLSSSHFTAAAGTLLSNYELPTTASGNVGKITPAPLVVRVNDSSAFVTMNASQAVDNGLSYTSFVNGETAANALNAGSQQTGCRRTQYADAPEVLSQSEFRFQPKPEFQNKCPYVIIGVDPYWGDVASRVEEKI